VILALKVGVKVAVSVLAGPTGLTGICFLVVQANVAMAKPKAKTDNVIQECLVPIYAPPGYSPLLEIRRPFFIPVFFSP